MTTTEVLIKSSTIPNHPRRRHPDQHPDRLLQLIILVDQVYLASQPTSLQPSRKPPTFVYQRMKLLGKFFLPDGQLQRLISYMPNGKEMKSFHNAENASGDLTF